MISIDTTIIGTKSEIHRVFRIVDELASDYCLSADVVADMNVALDEVLTNIITHGYSDSGSHEIRIRFSLDQCNLTVEVEDDGKPFNPLTAPPPDLKGSAKARRDGGVGIHFIKNLMNDIAYSFVDNRNRLVITKNLDSKDKGAINEHT